MAQCMTAHLAEAGWARHRPSHTDGPVACCHLRLLRSGHRCAELPLRSTTLPFPADDALADRRAIGAAAAGLLERRRPRQVSAGAVGVCVLGNKKPGFWPGLEWLRG